MSVEHSSHGVLAARANGRVGDLDADAASCPLTAGLASRDQSHLGILVAHAHAHDTVRAARERAYGMCLCSSSVRR